MLNSLGDSGNSLVSLDYSDLLTKILTVLQNPQTQNPFKITENGNRLIIDIDDIAFEIAALQIENPLGSASKSGRSATVNLSKNSQDSFIKQVQLIRETLRVCLQYALKDFNPNLTLEKYVEDLAAKLTDFHGNTKGLGLTYPFGKYQGLQKQRLSLQENNPDEKPLLKFHKLTITIENTDDFNEELKTGLENIIDVNFSSESESDREELYEILDDLVKNQKSDFHQLGKLMATETIGKIQKEAKIKYLEFIREKIGAHKDAIYLEDLIRRLKLIDKYINDVTKDDGHYEVNYAGCSVNFKEIFSRADAFDILPIIPMIAGYLGETRDENKGQQQFIFGLKLKFAGKVQSQGGENVFDYYMNLLDSNSQEHQEGLSDTFRKKFFVEKLFKIAFLYFFVFAAKDPSVSGYTPSEDLKYNPIPVFEEKVLPILQGSDDSLKQRRLRSIKKGFEKYNIKDKIEKLKELLKNILRRESYLQPRTYPLHVSIKQGILERDFNTISNNGTFFKSVLGENPKQALKYILVEKASVDTNSLCTLRASIKISDIRYFSTTDTQNFSMEYDLRNIRTIPVLLVPKEENAKRISQNNFQNKRLIEFNYNYRRLREQIFSNEDSPQAFVYRIAFSLLTYTSLKVLLDSVNRRFFIPIVRLHLGNKQNPVPEEEFMISFFSVLSHLLNEKHRCNSQGFCIKDLNRFKVSNGLSSLYSILPKKFQFTNISSAPQLEKLAIIVISSRECDRARGDNYKISNLIGEVIGVERQTDSSIRLYTIKHFSDNYDSQNMFSDPTVLIDEVNQLYDKGYKHFLYIAKSPYSSTLNMTNSEDDDKLFFMSTRLISALKGKKSDIKIYPVFYDKYYVVKLSNLKASSLYIQDTLELTHLVEDPSKKAVVFFNLFNGITVPGDDRFYNGVVSYATLLNIYEGILDDTDIRMGLMDDNPVKNDLLRYLTLFHFSRYEAAPRKDRNISLKLDPYQNIIGDYSVGALSVFNHMTDRVKFNLLAFLTGVRKALNVPSQSS